MGTDGVDAVRDVAGAAWVRATVVGAGRWSTGRRRQNPAWAGGRAWGVAVGMVRVEPVRPGMRRVLTPAMHRHKCSFEQNGGAYATAAKMPSY